MVLVFIVYYHSSVTSSVQSNGEFLFFFKFGIDLSNLHDICYDLTKICKCFSGSYPSEKKSNLIMNISHILLDFIFPVVEKGQFPSSFSNISLFKTEPT